MKIPVLVPFRQTFLQRKANGMLNQHGLSFVMQPGGRFALHAAKDVDIMVRGESETRYRDISIRAGGTKVFDSSVIIIANGHMGGARYRLSADGVRQTMAAESKKDTPVGMGYHWSTADLLGL